MYLPFQKYFKEKKKESKGCKEGEVLARWGGKKRLEEGF